MEAAFICADDLWARGFGATHPLKPDRLKRTYELPAAYSAFDVPNSHLIVPDPLSREDLLLFNTREYVDAVARLSSSRGRSEGDVQARRYGFRPDETPAFPWMYKIEGLKVGAALMGARLVAEGQVQVAFNFAGGLHHARPSLASGF